MLEAPIYMFTNTKVFPIRDLVQIIHNHSTIQLILQKYKIYCSWKIVIESMRKTFIELEGIITYRI